MHDPTATLVTNRDGALLTSGAAVIHHLVEQVVRPVRWDLCLEGLAALGTTGILELPPAGTLTSLARRSLPGVATCALTGPDVLDEARAFAASHRAL